jgi:hypothetical protein
MRLPALRLPTQVTEPTAEEEANAGVTEQLPCKLRSAAAVCPSLLVVRAPWHGLVVKVLQVDACCEFSQLLLQALEPAAAARGPRPWPPAAPLAAGAAAIAAAARGAGPFQPAEALYGVILLNLVVATHTLLKMGRGVWGSVEGH